MSDITDQEQFSLLDALLKSAPDFILSLDMQGTIRFINRTVTGLRAEELVGLDWLTFVAAEQREMMRVGLHEVLTTGQIGGWEMQVRGIDNQFTWLWARIGPLWRDGRIVGALVIARDLTEKKQLEHQLIMSDRMASVGVLATGVAHEINNPLAVVTANLEMAAADIETLPADLPVVKELREQLADARAAAERVRQIVRDLGVFSRYQDDKRGTVNVERVLELALRMSANEIRHRAQLVKTIEKTPLVIASESQLGQVFLHIIVSAAQSIVEGSAQHNKIHVSAGVDAGGRVVVTIADSGAGIPVDLQEKLFTSSATTKSVGGGFGIPQCRRIVASFGGELQIDSEITKGTTVRIILPAAPAEALAPAKPRRPAATPVESRRGKVLVIDDEPMITSAVQRILSGEHEVTVENTAHAAMALLRAGQRYDVILCDLMMPQMNGVEFHAALTQFDHEQAGRVVFLTGGAFSPNAIAFLESTTNPRMEKPFNTQKLRDLVGGLVQ